MYMPYINIYLFTKIIQNVVKVKRNTHVFGITVIMKALMKENRKCSTRVEVGFWVVTLG